MNKINIHKIFPQEIPPLLPTFEEPERCKRGIIGIFIAIMGIASETFSAFIRQR